MPGRFPPDVLEDIASRHGTPAYVYSWEKLDEQSAALRQAFAEHHATLCYAVKANPNGALLRHLFQQGFGADVVSGGELVRALRAGVDPAKVVFSGVGKRDDELEAGLAAKTLFNVESLDELRRLNGLATQTAPADVLLRVNPNIDAKTNPYIATGLYATKFGIAEADVTAAVTLARGLPHLRLRGLSCHLGSQITDASVFQAGAARMSALAAGFKAGHPEFDTLDLGGGLAVRYQDENPPALAVYAAAVAGAAAKAGLRLWLEPGRWIVAEAGGILTRVITVKQTPEKTFVVVDAAMNDLIRPSLYDAYHPVNAVRPKSGAAQTYDIVGPVCETGDFLALGRALPPVAAGDLLWIGVCGAYGSSMASTYNSRPRAPEIAFDPNGKTSLIRERETIKDLFSLEKP